MIAVLGAGAFGTALAVTLAANGPVRLWARDASSLLRDRVSPRLPGIHLPDAVCPTGDLDELDGHDLLLAVPMQQLRSLLPRLSDLHVPHAVAACKGIDLQTLQTPADLIADALPDTVPALLSGPSFAADIARGLPTALTLACAYDAAGARLQAALSTPTLRLYRSTDMTGVALGGALKNVVAIACGAAIGAGLGESARAALMTRGMAEMMRLSTALGARPETLMGLSGLGDLALTCASPQSRNFALGLALGRGDPPPDATTEGVATARAALRLGARHGIDLPVTQATAGLVDGTLTVETAIQSLLARDLTTETPP
ncbi:NAD(P)H-dependent glycerol-3-phosphate dehydrogenase [Jannaschia seohaensis]|uniref:Glycerol-3-phosphate dehydrogenase [NAD(P)+] n=1 Tax=Jannaschia seohaensis TaxID=475081 RepID=A0A2Y9BY19_9RHOB|nr:NAD(P)H-dependent glycerol-3-phosphate dehydrogenase [Jannaschia seohaensis]PWJ21333.1 glycerol-3-phosphate dehydrogenase (NAD(P)+) [Jannaschia seohaensis]SSA41852.1 glycerol-3-phosphate dehydrogenase (NAD(P)+) [Jannaschia seohaensis]